MWPEQANSDAAFARRAARCGELRMCSLGTWKYGWQPLTVHIGRLGKSPARSIPGCPATAASAASPEPVLAQNAKPESR
ncbi:MAG: hypothetical protein ACM336_02335 [Acidobacteriota bacterium]